MIFKDFASEFICQMTQKKGKKIVKYFLNHVQALAIFRDNSKSELLKVAKTQFTSHNILLRRLITYREALSTTIACNSWGDREKQGDEHSRQVVKAIDTSEMTTFGSKLKILYASRSLLFCWSYFAMMKG